MGKAILIVLAVIGVLALTCVGASMIGGWWLVKNSGPPENVSITVGVPPRVVEGQTFDIVINVTDTGGSPRTIKDIDLSETLFAGFTFENSDPRFVAFDPAFGIATITLDAAVPASGVTTARITLRAETPGTYSGDVDVSVDSIFRIHTTPTTIVIDPAPGGG